MLVRWIGMVGGVVLVLGGTPVAAQSPADAYFHEAAQQYVAGNEAAARQSVEQGLEVAPSDPRLQALLDKLNRESDDRGGGGGAQQSPQSREQDETSEGEEGAEERGASEERGDEGSDEAGSEPSSSQQSEGGGQAGGNARRAGNQPSPERASEPRNALTRAQAARLLRALQNQETNLLREVRARASETESVEKDW